MKFSRAALWMAIPISPGCHAFFLPKSHSSHFKSHSFGKFGLPEQNGRISTFTTTSTTSFTALNAEKYYLDVPDEFDPKKSKKNISQPQDQTYQADQQQPSPPPPQSLSTSSELSRRELQRQRLATEINNAEAIIASDIAKREALEKELLAKRKVLEEEIAQYTKNIEQKRQRLERLETVGGLAEGLQSVGTIGSVVGGGLITATVGRDVLERRRQKIEEEKRRAEEERRRREEEERRRREEQNMVKRRTIGAIATGAVTLAGILFSNFGDSIGGLGGKGDVTNKGDVATKSNPATKIDAKETPPPPSGISGVSGSLSKGPELLQKLEPAPVKSMVPVEGVATIDTDAKTAWDVAVAIAKPVESSTMTTSDVILAKSDNVDAKRAEEEAKKLEEAREKATTSGVISAKSDNVDAKRAKEEAKKLDEARAEDGKVTAEKIEADKESLKVKTDVDLMEEAAKREQPWLAEKRIPEEQSLKVKMDVDVMEEAAMRELLLFSENQSLKKEPLKVVMDVDVMEEAAKRERSRLAEKRRPEEESLKVKMDGDVTEEAVKEEQLLLAENQIVEMDEAAKRVALYVSKDDEAITTISASTANIEPVMKSEDVTTKQFAEEATKLMMKGARNLDEAMQQQEKNDAEEASMKEQTQPAEQLRSEKESPKAGKQADVVEEAKQVMVQSQPSYADALEESAVDDDIEISDSVLVAVNGAIVVTAVVAAVSSGSFGKDETESDVIEERGNEKRQTAVSYDHRQKEAASEANAAAMTVDKVPRSFRANPVAPVAGSPVADAPLTSFDETSELVASPETEFPKQDYDLEAAYATSMAETANESVDKAAEFVASSESEFPEDEMPTMAQPPSAPIFKSIPPRIKNQEPPDIPATTTSITGENKESTSQVTSGFGSPAFKGFSPSPASRLPPESGSFSASKPTGLVASPGSLSGLSTSKESPSTPPLTASKEVPPKIPSALDTMRSTAPRPGISSPGNKGKESAFQVSSSFGSPRLKGLSSAPKSRQPPKLGTSSALKPTGLVASYGFRSGLSNSDEKSSTPPATFNEVSPKIPSALEAMRSTTQQTKKSMPTESKPAAPAPPFPLVPPIGIGAGTSYLSGLSTARPASEIRGMGKGSSFLPPPPVTPKAFTPSIPSALEAMRSVSPSPDAQGPAKSDPTGLPLNASVQKVSSPPPRSGMSAYPKASPPRSPVQFTWTTAEKVCPSTTPIPAGAWAVRQMSSPATPPQASSPFSLSSVSPLRAPPSSILPLQAFDSEAPIFSRSIPFVPKPAVSSSLPSSSATAEPKIPSALDAMRSTNPLDGAAKITGMSPLKAGLIMRSYPAVTPIGIEVGSSNYVSDESPPTSPPVTSEATVGKPSPIPNKGANTPHLTVSVTNPKSGKPRIISVSTKTDAGTK